MAEDNTQSVLRRKLAARKPAAEAAGVTPVKALRLALARAAQHVPGLELVIEGMTEARRSLTEVLDMPPDRALLAMLGGPGESLGLIAIAPGVLAGLIEVMTMGRAAAGEPAARKPTRTDAAMSAGLIDRALAGVEEESAASQDVVWAGGFRYASFLDDPRPLGLLLEDVTYRVFQVTLSLAGGARRGELLLVLPAQGRGAAPMQAPVAPAEVEEAPVTLADVVMGASAQLTAVLHRVTIPLAAVLRLQAGDVLPIPAAALERIVLEGGDGRRLAEGKLGQNRGNRAVRLSGQVARSSAATADMRPAAGAAG
jgi:flagellar motor switch protein FliM